VRLNAIDKFLEAFDKLEGCRIEKIEPTNDTDN
jgi:hypothetical protein